MAEFLAMGGYAAYVWPAYGLTLVVIAGLFLSAAACEKRLLRRLARAEQRRGAHASGAA